MDGTQILQRLAAQSAGEADPTIDVRAQVLRQLRRQPVRNVDRNLAIVSICACSLATIVFATSVLPARETDSIASFSKVVTNNTGPEALLKLVEP